MRGLLVITALVTAYVMIGETYADVYTDANSSLRRDIEIDDRADVVSRYFAQASVLLISVISFFIVINPPQYIAELAWIGISGVAAATVAPVIGIYFPNFVTRKGVIAALVAGVVSYIGVSLFLDIPSVFVEGMIDLILATMVMLLVCALTEQEANVAVVSDQHKMSVSREDDSDVSATIDD